MSITAAMARQCAAPSILFVDDEEDILPEYQELLEIEGFESLICSDPEKAAQMVLEQPSISLVITDLRMAKLDGASLINKLRALLPIKRYIEFIILTGDATYQASENISNIKVFIKPIDTDELIREIKSALFR